jgi:TolA-binding protein
VLLSDQAGVSAHLLEVNSNPSLGITHDIEPEDQEAHVLDLAHATGTAGWGRARPVSTAVASRKAIQVPSPIDEEIKTSVVRDTLRLVMASGQQQQQQQRRRPRQEQGQEVQQQQQQQQQQRQRQRQRQQHGRYAIAADGEATQFLPVVTAATEAGYSPLMVFDRVRRAFEACAGGASALQRHGGCLTSGDFRRAAAALGVRNADADIAFVKLVRSASSAQDGGFNNRTMELPTFVDGLEVLAEHPNATPALRFAAADCFGGEEREQGRRGRGEGGGGGGAGQDQNQQCRRRCVIETAAELIIAALCR